MSETLLDVVVRELDPLAATLFNLGEDGDVRSSFVRGDRALRKAAMRGVDSHTLEQISSSPRPVVTLSPEPHRDIGAINDAWLPIRDGERLIAAINLWRSMHGPAWTGRDLRLLATLQPLIEMAYASATQGASSVEALLPPGLTRRQRQVARMLAAGATNPEVARALHISPDTAKSHSRAVLAKWGVASRRELVMALTPPRAGDMGVGGEGDETAEHFLSLVLDWAGKRIGAIVGGCSLLSARLEPIAQASATARVGARHLDPSLVRRLHSEVVRRAVPDRLRSAVQQLALAEDDLAVRLGLGEALLTVLRVQGRVAGLIWLSWGVGAGGYRRERTQALRNLHPLLELAYAAPLALAQSPPMSFAELAERGLTSRELSVARLALDGQGNTDIAATLGISQSTVKHHMSRVLAKCGVRSRTQLIALVADGAD